MQPQDSSNAGVAFGVNLSNSSRRQLTMRLARATLPLLLFTTLLAAPVRGLLAADKVGPDPAAVKETATKGVKYLQSAQAADGTWTSPQQPGVTALCLYGLLKSGVDPADEGIQKGLKYLEGLQQKDGGIYREGTFHKNYETAIALMAFQAANKDGKYDKLVATAADFLRGIQWGGADKTEKSEVPYGGAGYGKSARPDLSNTTFFLEALKASGAKSDDPAVQKALVFVSRCQNLESEHNTTPHASKVNDGGFYYTVAAGGSSQAGANPDGGLRSYASMTYAGLKSMIYAGLKADDPRVKAARAWIQKFYTVAENPGLEDRGLYYYYQTFAKTLDTVGDDLFEDAAGKKHDWRKELVEKLASLQKENGSWVNKNDRWMEADPNLSTAYALIALSYCHPPTK